jgi:LysM repeat protein
MVGRNPARFLAPIALLAFAFALYTVVQDARAPAGGDSSSGSPANASPTASSTKGSKRTSRRARTYTVKSGDTLSGIAEKTGVSSATLQKLNPRLDPGTLSPGQKLKLR